MLQESSQRIYLTPKQAEAWKIIQNKKIVLFGGAIRGGKTVWLILSFWMLAKKYANSKWVIIRNSNPNLENNTLKSLKGLLDMGLDVDVLNWNQKNKIITLYNKSEIQFMSESYEDDKELNRFKGLEINGAGFDEINECQKQTFEKMIERSGTWFHSPGCPTKILATCNPTKNWVKEVFYDRYITGKLPSNYAYIPSKITDNPHVPKEYFEGLRNDLTNFHYTVFVDGDWEIQLKSGSEFYKSFDPEKHIKPSAYDPTKPLHISFDENVNPYLPCAIYQVAGKAVMQIDEIAAKTPYNTIESICNQFKKKYPNHTSGLFIYGDATSQKDDTKLEKGQNFFILIMGYLKDYKPHYRIPKSNPSVVMRGNFINTILEKNIQGISIQFDPCCKYSILDMSNVKEASDGTKNKDAITDKDTKVRYQPYGHFSDCLDYFICYAFSNEYVIYQKGGIVTSPMVGLRTSKNVY